jgi:hypothetical protein
VMALVRGMTVGALDARRFSRPPLVAGAPVRPSPFVQPPPPESR